MSCKSSPRSRATVLLLACFALSGLEACGTRGEGGQGGGGSSPGTGSGSGPASGSGSDDLTLTTDVALDAMAYRLPPSSSCLKFDATRALPALSGKFTLDGDLSEWTKTASSLDDPAGDAPAGFDLSQTWIAAVGSDVAIAVVAKPDANASINFAFGGALSRNGNFIDAQQRWLRIYQGRLEEQRDGAWSAVAGDLGSVKLGPLGAEVYLTQRYIGEVTSYPVWWVRAFTRDEAADAFRDSTNTVYFRSELNSDLLPFDVGACTYWYTRKLPIDVISVRDSLKSVPVPASDDPQVPAPLPFPLEKTDDRVQSMVRLAIDQVERVFDGVPMPVSTLTVITTLNKVPDPALPVLVAEPEMPAAYGAITLNLGDFGPDATTPFPEGKAFGIVFERLADLYLSAAFPSAPPVLRSGVARALADLQARDIFGAAYFFDHYRATVADFVAKPDDGGTSTAPVSLLNPARHPQKLTAWSHLMAGSFNAKDLVAAWKAAASSPGSSTPDQAMRSALAALRPLPVADDLVSCLWRGWFSTEPYCQLFGPSAVGDTDRDGIPDHYERIFGTNPKLADTDGDSWSDYAEIVRKSDPLAVTNAPNRVMPDGDFDDWLTLFPKKVLVDQGKSDACPVAADITFYAALATPDSLVIGAVAREFWDADPKARWEAAIDLPLEKRQLLVTVASDSYATNVTDTSNQDKKLLTIERAFPQGRKTVEWVFRRQDLRLEHFFDEADAVKIRLRTVFNKDNKDIYCDETSWFSPYLTTTGS